MSTPLEKFEQLEHRRLSLLQKIQYLPEEIKYLHPKAGKWSIAQILEHLRVAEKQTLKAIQRNIGNTDILPEATLRSDFNLFIALLRFASRVPIKAPAYVSNIAERPDLMYVLEDWQTVRNSYKKLISDLPAYMEHKIIFKHPIVGNMNTHHVLRFFHAHFRVHERQVLRIITKNKG